MNRRTPLGETPLLKADQIAFSKEKPILKGVSFELKPGTCLTLLGPSGSGKSSLLRCLNRLETIDSGTITLEGVDIRTLNPAEIRRRVGLVFQSPALLPLSLAENIALGPKLAGNILSEEDLLARLREVGLAGMPPDRRVDTLSIGEQQRVALAQVLANDPQVLLLDEPTSALDPTAMLTIERLIQSIHRTKKTATLWVTHDLAQARRIDAETLVLVEGKILAQGPIRQLMDSENKDALQRFFQGDLQ